MQKYVLQSPHNLLMATSQTRRWSEGRTVCCVMCTVMCIAEQHNSMSISDRSVDVTVLISLSLALSSKSLCNFFYLWHYI